MATLTQAPDSPVPIGKAFTRFRDYLQRPRLSHKDRQAYLDWFTKGRHRGHAKPRLRKRRHMHKARYFWVKEPHMGGGANNGNLHLHVGLDVYIPQPIIKAAWEKATQGHGEITFINDSKSGNIRNMAGYMSKYITKTLGNYYDGFKSGERRYQFSSHEEFKKAKYVPEHPVTFNFDSQKYHDGIRAKAMPGARALWDELTRRRSTGGDPPGRYHE